MNSEQTKRSGRWVIPAIVAVVAVVAAGAIYAGRIDGTEDQPVEASVTATATPTPSDTPTPTATAAPAVFYAPAVFDGWTTAGDGDMNTHFSVNGDTVRNGAGALRVDSTTVAVAPHRSLTQTIPSQPSTTYSISAWYQSPDARPHTAPLTMTAGSSAENVFEFPNGATEWTQVNWQYTTGVGESSTVLSINPGGQVAGFLLDELSITVAGASDSGLKNGSFDSFNTNRSVLNDTLVMSTGTAVLDVAWFTRSLDWVLVDQAGEQTAAGNQMTDGGVAELQFQSIAQGYYGLSVTAEGSSDNAITTQIMIVNPINVEPDNRFGVAGHIDKPVYEHSEKSAADIGLTSIRTDGNWNAIEKSVGQYAFPDRYESSYSDFKNAGLSVLPISNGKNPLYDNNKMPSSTRAVDAFGNATAALVSHYGAEAVEIYNEPNTTRFNNSTCGIQAECYLPLLQASYSAVKASSPQTIVVGPANANQDDPWLTALYKAGGLNSLDAVSYHPYEATPEPLINNIQQARNRIAEYSGGAHKPIWLTEFGWTSSTNSVSEQTQANYLVRSEVIALANGVERVYWYDLVNDTPDPADHESNFGLLKAGNALVPAFEPKPAAMAQAVLIRQLGGKSFVADESIGSEAYSFAYGSDANAVRVAWSTTSATLQFESTVPLTVTTAMGSESQIAPVGGIVKVNTSEEPTYISGASSAAVLSTE